MGESPFLNTFRAEAKVQKARDWLTELLEAKYQREFTPDFRQTIARETSETLLNRWFQSALRLDTWADFVASLK